MTTDRATLLQRAASLQERTAASSTLWKYTLEDGIDLFLLKKQTTIRSPESGKTFTIKPERVSLSEIGKELKAEAKSEKVKKASDDFWKASNPTPKTAAKGTKTLPGTLWEYVEEDGGKFYLSKRMTGTIKSPFTGKSFPAKPLKNTLSDVSDDLKENSKKASTEPTTKVAMTLEEATQLKHEVLSELREPKVACQGACACGGCDQGAKEADLAFLAGKGVKASFSPEVADEAYAFLSAGERHPSMQALVRSFKDLVASLESSKKGADYLIRTQGSNLSVPSFIESQILPKVEELAKTAFIVSKQMGQRFKLCPVTTTAL